MKKYFLISAFLLFLPVIASAFTTADLKGIWSSVPNSLGEIEEGVELSIVDQYTFGQNGKVISGGYVMYTQNKEGITIEVKIRKALPGTYKIEGDNIIFNFDPSKFSLECEYDDISITGDVDPQTKELQAAYLVLAIKAEFIEPLKAQFQQLIGNGTQNWNKVTVSPSAITYEINGHFMWLTKD